MVFAKVAAAIAACGLLLLQAEAALVFSPLSFSWDPATERHQVRSSRSVVSGTDTAVLTSNDAEHVVGSYQVVARSGPGYEWGQLVDQSGGPVYKLADETLAKTDEVDGSNAPDAVSILRKSSDGSAYLVLHFESPEPSLMTIAKLEQDADTGVLTVATNISADWSAWGGITHPCAGSTSPWDTHLGSEEYDPNARLIDTATSYEALLNASSRDATRVAAMVRYFGLYASDYASVDEFLAAAKEKYFPYKYGHITEVAVAADGTPTLTKWYTLGRAAWEMPLVMPDNKTVYIADDGGRNVGFFKFVMDTAGDLSSGTLYAAKATQKSDTNGGDFDLAWIELGTGTQSDLVPQAETLKFADIFEYAEPVNATCPEGFNGSVGATTGEECLKLKAGMETAAAFFETRRYAAVLGATVEFSKWEGITFDPTRNVLYAALTGVDVGMLAEPDRLTGTDHVALPENKCGCVYSLAVEEGTYNINSMTGLLCGDPLHGQTANFGVANNVSECNIDGISSPDNLYYIESQDALLIAEDSEYHEPNMMWWYDLATKELTRIQTAPIGAEITGTHVFTLNGYTYIWSNIQHPYEDQESLLEEPESTGTGGWIGYLGPFKPADASTPAWGLSHVTQPPTKASRHLVHSSTRVVYGERQPISYQIQTRGGTKAGGVGPAITGALLTANGSAVMLYKTPGEFSAGNEGSEPDISTYADHYSIQAICDKRFAMLHHEADNPAAMEIMTLSQADNGTITTTGGQPVDWSPWGGLWTPCAGSITFWNTRLGGEEYEPNARAVEAANTTELFAEASSPLLDMTRYYGLYMPGADEARTVANPYRYGGVYEARVQYDGSVNAIKLLVAGRVATELGYAMPDGRTIYNTDDGANVGWFKLVADVPYDLTAGTLYAAKMNQTDAANGGTFDIEWVLLGSGKAEELLALAETLKFSDVFDAAAPLNTSGVLSCPEGYTSVNTQGACECLQLKAGMEKAAAFFETRRYAAMLGATTEFSKWEGISYDADHNKLYTAMSVVRQGMEDNKVSGEDNTKFDQCGPNHVRVEYNRCGCVYQLDVDENYSATRMYALVCGKADESVEDNECAINGISEPDNLAYVSGHHQVLIGEDTDGHQNDVIWLYDLETKELTRIFSTPYGAETTSAFWYPRFGGPFAYIAATVQHPYGESDEDRVDDANSFGPNSVSGVIGPIPSINGTDPVSACTDAAYVVVVDVTFAGTPKAADLKARIASFLQYKVERVLGSLAGVMPGDVASRAKDGDAIAFTVRVVLSEKATADQLVTDLPAAADKLDAVVALLLDGGSTTVSSTGVIEATRKAGLDMATNLAASASSP